MGNASALKGKTISIRNDLPLHGVKALLWNMVANKYVDESVEYILGFVLWEKTCKFKPSTLKLRIGKLVKPPKTGFGA